MSFDPELFGQAMGDAIIKAVQPLKEEIARLKSQLAEMSQPIAGKDGVDGRDDKYCDMEVVRQMVEDAVKAIPVIQGKDGKDGAPGKDGAGIADLLIDRDGALIATFTDGRMKSLGKVIGRDGKDGKDGLSLESFELEYLPESHEISIKATAAGRERVIRFPAGGIHAKGYWREGVKAIPGEAWTHDGSLWIARSATTTKPGADSPDWFLAARKGRDGERGPRGKDSTPVVPVKIEAGK